MRGGITGGVLSFVIGLDLIVTAIFTDNKTGYYAVAVAVLILIAGVWGCG